MVVCPESGPLQHSQRRRAWGAFGIVGAVLVAAAAVALPGRFEAQRNANESAVIATLKNISSAQAQCHAGGVIDVDRNGVGEHGFFDELTGRVPVRGGKAIVPLLSNIDYGAVVDSRCMRSGYLFQMFLPDRLQRGVAEDASGGDAGNDNGVDPRQAELLWCCYAWPRSQGWTGQRTFFVNQSGDVLASLCQVVAYDGVLTPCPFFAAFAASSSVSMAAAIAACTVAHDGNVWVVIG